MSGSDLTPLLTPGGAPDWGFRQGEVISFDAEVGTSSVRVGGSVLTDVPFLSQAGQVQYLPGDAVLLVRFKSSWAIVGRYVTPGPGWAAAIGRYTEITGSYYATPSTNFAVTTSWATVNSVGIYTPLWAYTATITATFMARARNSTGADDTLWSRINANGVTLGGLRSGTIPSTKFGDVTATGHVQILATPGATLTIDGQVGSGANWSAHADNEAHVQATVTWNSNLG